MFWRVSIYVSWDSAKFQMRPNSAIKRLGLGGIGITLALACCVFGEKDLCLNSLYVLALIVSLHIHQDSFKVKLLQSILNQFNVR
jgi:hypothetical protein